MSEKKTPAQLPEQPKKKYIQAPVTKTFKFEADTPPEIIDYTVKEWVIKTALEGKQPLPGKSFSNHKTGCIFIIYAYAQSIELPS